MLKKSRHGSLQTLCFTPVGAGTGSTAGAGTGPAAGTGTGPTAGAGTGPAAAVFVSIVVHGKSRLINSLFIRARVPTTHAGA